MSNQSKLHDELNRYKSENKLKFVRGTKAVLYNVYNNCVSFGTS